jgi:hypothetical protein
LIGFILGVFHMEKPTLQVLIVGGVVFAGAGVALAYSRRAVPASTAAALPDVSALFNETPPAGLTAAAAAPAPEYGGQPFALAAYTPPDLTAEQIAPNNPGNMSGPPSWLAGILTAIQNAGQIVAPSLGGGCGCNGGLPWVAT